MGTNTFITDSKTENIQLRRLLSSDQTFTKQLCLWFDLPGSSLQRYPVVDSYHGHYLLAIESDRPVTKQMPTPELTVTMPKQVLRTRK